MNGYVDFKGKADGSSTTKGYEKHVKIKSLSFGVTRPVSSSSSSQRSAERATLQDIIITKEQDKSSPKLFGLACSGATIDNVVITLTTFVGEGQESVSAKIELTKVIVTSFSASGQATGGSGGHDPDEMVTLNFATIKYTYIVRDDANASPTPIDTAWSVTENASM